MRATEDPDNTAGKRYPNSTYKDPNTPTLRTSFEDLTTLPPCARLLRTNRLVYLEALPILYHSTTFALWDPDGSFPLFLEGLSPFARSHTRYVRMGINNPQSSAWYFNWALACAQVAKLNASLRLVEVKVNPSYMKDDSFRKRAIVYPLLKISAPKVLLDGCDAKLQHALAEAGADLDAKIDQRKALSAADFADGTRLANLERFDYDHPIKKPMLTSLPLREKREDFMPISSIDERELTHDMSMIPGIEECKLELFQWDMVSDAIAATIPISQVASITSTDPAGCTPSTISDSPGS
jgi:hypothetical protein